MSPARKNLDPVTWANIEILWVGKEVGNDLGKLVSEHGLMFNTPKHQLIRQGHQLAEQLDQSLTRIKHRPVPVHWGTVLTEHATLGDLVRAVRRFDHETDLLLRELLLTPVGDEQASLILLVGLLPGVIYRHRNRAHRVADTLTELALYVSQRRPLRSQRHALGLILDEADRCSRRSLIKENAHNERTTSLPDSDTLVGRPGISSDVEEIVITHLQLDDLRAIGCQDKDGIDIDRLLVLSEQTGLNDTDRQYLSRQRRRARELFDYRLGQAA